MSTHTGWGSLAALGIIMNIIALIALWQYRVGVEIFFLILFALVVVSEQYLRHGRIRHEVETPLTYRLPPAPTTASPLYMQSEAMTYYPQE